MQSTIQKWGNSQGIRLPKHVLEAAFGNEVLTGEPIEVELLVEENRITVTKAAPKRRRGIEELFSGYKGRYEAVDVDWGAPAGKEIW